MSEFRYFGGVGLAVKAINIFADLRERDCADRFARELFANLAENPWIADGMAADHHARCAGIF